MIIKTGLLAGALQVHCLRSLHVCLKQKDIVFPNFPTLSSYYLLDSFLKMGSLAPCRSRRLRQKGRPPTPRQGKDQLFFLRSTQTATPQNPRRRSSDAHLSPVAGLELCLSSYLSHFPTLKMEEWAAEGGTSEPRRTGAPGASWEQHDCPKGPFGIDPASCLGRPVTWQAEGTGPNLHKPTTPLGAAFCFSRHTIHKP